MGNFEYDDDLNKFYAKFDCHDFENEREEIKNTLEGRLTNVNERIVLKRDEICNVLKRMKANKTS